MLKIIHRGSLSPDTAEFGFCYNDYNKCGQPLNCSLTGLVTFRVGSRCDFFINSLFLSSVLQCKICFSLFQFGVEKTCHNAIFFDKKNSTFLYFLSFLQYIYGAPSLDVSICSIYLNTCTKRQKVAEKILRITVFHFHIAVSKIFSFSQTSSFCKRSLQNVKPISIG